MKWDPIEYDNITYMRVPFDEVWTPGTWYFIERIAIENNMRFYQLYLIYKKTLFYITQPIRLAGINGTLQVSCLIGHTCAKETSSIYSLFSLKSRSFNKCQLWWYSFMYANGSSKCCVQNWCSQFPLWHKEL